MKNLKNLGTLLTQEEQRAIKGGTSYRCYYDYNGGSYWEDCYGHITWCQSPQSYESVCLMLGGCSYVPPYCG